MRKEKNTEKRSAPSRTIMVLYTQTSCMMMVWTFETILRDKFWTSCLEEFRMWYSGWPDPSYLDCWPFGILTEKAILRIPLKKKSSGTRIFNFTQGNVGYSGRVNWCLGCYKTIYSAAKKRVFLIWGPLPVVLFGCTERKTRKIWNGSLIFGSWQRKFMRV